MAVLCEIRNGAGVVTLTGAFTAANTESFRQQFAAWFQSAPDVRHIVIDLGGVDFMDSSALGTLIGTLKRVAERNGEIRIARPRPNVRMVFEITRANKILPLHDTTEAALAVWSGSSAQ
jgi:anti-sigma B factor antagonist